MLNKFSVLLLDMNDTFMFGTDRFGADQDYSIVYRRLGGKLQPNIVNQLIQSAYDYLDERYPDFIYQDSFPSVRDAFLTTSKEIIPTDQELDILIETFGHHELGHVPVSYSETLQRLAKRFRLGLVADIWAPPTLWIDELSHSGVLNLFEVTIFSSNSGIVKPSARPFIQALERMQADVQDALVIGDSVRRDLGGAVAAKLPCLLVGGATHPSAYGALPNILTLVDNDS